MGKFKDLTGQRFSRLLVLERKGSNKSGCARWSCLCDCGKETVADMHNLTNGYTRSCGCLKRESLTTHGMHLHKIYNVWSQMKNRCDSPSSACFSDYGGRGISYDPHWGIFENFLKDMSDSYEEHLTLDRIDNNKGYSKENCRWTTASVQNRNRRKKPGCQIDYIGVSATRSGRFRAQIRVDNKTRHLGTFNTAIEAATAYDSRCEEFGCGRPNGTVKTTGE